MIKKMINRFFKFLKDKDYRFLLLSEIGLFNQMPDEEFLQKKFKSIMGKDLNLQFPQTYNEKIQWLKLYDRNPLYTILVDKILAKQWVSSIIGEQYIIPTIGVWSNPDDIDFYKIRKK